MPAIVPTDEQRGRIRYRSVRRGMTDATLGPQYIAERIEHYIAQRLGYGAEVTITSFARIAGGASQQTYRFIANWSAGDRTPISRRLILRRQPKATLLETKQATEFAVYRAFHGTGVPVPEMLWIEDSLDIIGAPFFIAEELSGFEADPNLLQQSQYRALHPYIAEQKWSILGRIAQIDANEIGLDGVLEPVLPSDVWKRELNYWEGVIIREATQPQPIMSGAIRYLRANPPPPAQKICVVHGDYRCGNFLYDGSGKIHGILDWEMAHLGDPLEDLAWGFNRIWNYARDGRMGGLTTRENAIAIWEASSGLAVDPAALRWWMVFNCVKGQAIWLSAAKTWNDGQNRELILAFSAWYAGNSQDRSVLEAMELL